MRSGVDIIVACPGRLEDLMKQGIVNLSTVEITVLDEADHMADLGFLPGVTRILAATPAGGQRMLFSATLDRGVDKLSRRFLSDPVSHELDESSVPVGELTHRVLLVRGGEEKKELVSELASGRGRRILFTRTKHQAKRLAKQLTASGIPAVDLHGNLSQNARDRNLAAFSAGPEHGGVRVLVATDVAARGVHVDDVDLVVHVDPPMEHKAYLHRSGRTARAGASGTVVTVVLPEQRNEMRDLLKKARIQVQPERVSAGDTAIQDLVGEHAPYVRPTVTAPPAHQQRKPSGRGRSNGSQGSRSRGGNGGRGASHGGRDAGARSGDRRR